MSTTRREFLIFTAVTALSGCTRHETKSVTIPSTAVDIGTAADYPTDGVYDKFREKGFFIIRRDNNIWALSSVCTHMKCKIHPQNDRTFLCKCHGSTFDENGKVTDGPATKNEPRLAMAIDRDRLIVDPARVIWA